MHFEKNMLRVKLQGMRFDEQYAYPEASVWAFLPPG
jgi:hypothetical protein